MTHFSVKIVHTKICIHNETSQQAIQILRSFSRTNINLHDKSIYQLPRILHGKTLKHLQFLHGVHFHILHEPML